MKINLMISPKHQLKIKILDKQKRYHIHHPFHIAMNSGKCSKKQVQYWVANRYYYQTMIPRKDAAIIANCPDSSIRSEWVKRIYDHDVNGGIDAWESLAKSVDLDIDDLRSFKFLLPGVKFSVDAYYNFCKTADYKDAMATSLTELFAPEIHKKRLESWPVHYPWINEEGYNYFRKRLGEARRDVNFTLDFVLDEYSENEVLQNTALSLVDFKLDILWTMLDSIEKKTIDYK